MSNATKKTPTPLASAYAVQERERQQFVDSARAGLVTHAVIEMMDWVHLLEQHHLDGQRFERMAPAMFKRVKALGSVILSASDDDMETNESISSRLAGGES